MGSETTVEETEAIWVIMSEPYGKDGDKRKEGQHSWRWMDQKDFLEGRLFRMLDQMLWNRLEEQKGALVPSVSGGPPNHQLIPPS
ncbi:hypothetical protein BSKO_09343 [Bryopsis sp. KO-2023]|nr:hypothetical protein BSKO_09343 [Bryopsis sp. KO-2023]